MANPFKVDKGLLMEAVLERHDVRYRDTYTGWQKVRCPSDNHAHGDRNPSASVNTAIGQYICFACDLKGDGFDLMLQLEDMKAPAVLGILTGMAPAKVESEWLL